MDAILSLLHFMKNVNLQFSNECLLIPLMFITVHAESIHNPSVRKTLQFKFIKDYFTLS